MNDLACAKGGGGRGVPPTPDFGRSEGTALLNAHPPPQISRLWHMPELICTMLHGPKDFPKHFVKFDDFLEVTCPILKFM